MAENNEPLVDKDYLLEKFKGKGGWTYAAIPEILQAKNTPFGWVRVKGSIDGYEIKNYRLMPMGNGKLFFAVKTEIRKKIAKKEGDWIRIILYADDAPTEISEELIACLMEVPKAYEAFLSYSDGEQKAFIDWIYTAKTDETKVKRIVETIDKVLKSKKVTDK